MAHPPGGYYSRGDVLSGYRFISAATGFWFLGGRQAWRWDSTSSRWATEAGPPEADAIALAPLGQSMLFVVRKVAWSDTATAFLKADGGWHEVHSDIKDLRVDHVLALQDAAYFLTPGGDLLTVDFSGMSRLSTPAVCDGATTSSDGKLLVSFLHRRIFLYRNGWEQLYPCPYSPQEDRIYWVHLAEEHGLVAFAMHSARRTEVVKSDEAALWISDAGTLQQVSLRVK